jgi:hypothetical protein
VGFVPSSTSPFRATMNAGTRVPSRPGTKTCVVSNCEGSKGRVGARCVTLAPLVMSYRYTVAGAVKDVNV